MATLLMRYQPDPTDEVGRLWFELQTESFSDTTYFWSNLSELPEMIEKLRTYLWDKPVRWAWGFNEVKGNDAVAMLEISKAGEGGGLKATVELANYDDTSQRLSASLRPDYVSLDVLRRELSAMYDQRTGEAVLTGQ